MGKLSHTHDFEIKDSGNRTEFESGMVRDTADDKVNWSLIADGPMLKRWAIHLTNGAKKYAARNWMKASGQAELDRFKESAYRHFMDWYYGVRDEDHAAAVFFNINGAEYVQAQKDESDMVEEASMAWPNLVEPEEIPTGFAHTNYVWQVKTPAGLGHPGSARFDIIYVDDSGNWWERHDTDTGGNVWSAWSQVERGSVTWDILSDAYLEQAQPGDFYEFTDGRVWDIVSLDKHAKLGNVVRVES